jgi:hypothetical protein
MELTENGTNGKRNFRLFAAIGNESFFFLGRQTINVDDYFPANVPIYALSMTAGN